MKSKLYITLFLATSLFLSSCENELIDVVKGSGPVVTESRYTSSFEELALSIPADVYITQGPDEKIVIHAQDNVLDVIRTDVRNHELEIRFDNGVVVKRHEPVKVYITTHDINNIRISGSGNVYNDTPIIGHQLNLDISGSGHVDLVDIDVDILDANISGSGKLYLDGYTTEQYLQISGSGGIFAYGLACEMADINISGSGKTEVSVEEYLNATISGSGNIYYRGHPTVESRISGSGAIYHVD